MLKINNALLLIKSLIKIKDKLTLKLKLLRYTVKGTSRSRLKTALSDLRKSVLPLYTFLLLTAISITLVRISLPLNIAFTKD
jgi:hypothetical protein